mmetsp:Transcript_3195/g.7290  ORF Transcript_3195/g.7290 Transcript_3195/m.7290 type:complete len:257 (+) Transcript_3195:532-1302(+)
MTGGGGCCCEVLMSAGIARCRLAGSACRSTLLAEIPVRLPEMPRVYQYLHAQASRRPTRRYHRITTPSSPIIATSPSSAGPSPSPRPTSTSPASSAGDTRRSASSSPGRRSSTPVRASMTRNISTTWWRSSANVISTAWRSSSTAIRTPGRASPAGTGRRAGRWRRSGSISPNWATAGPPTSPLRRRPCRWRGMPTICAAGPGRCGPSSSPGMTLRPAPWWRANPRRTISRGTTAPCWAGWRRPFGMSPTCWDSTS